MFYIGDMSRRQHYWLIYSIYCNTHIRTNVKLLNASFSHYLLHYKQRRTNWHIHKCKCIFLSVTEAPNMHCFTPYDLTLCWHNQIHPICRLWKTVMRDQPKHSNALLTSNVGCFQFMFSPPPPLDWPTALPLNKNQKLCLPLWQHMPFLWSVFFLAVLYPFFLLCHAVIWFSQLSGKVLRPIA